MALTAGRTTDDVASRCEMALRRLISALSRRRHQALPNTDPDSKLLSVRAVRLNCIVISMERGHNPSRPYTSLLSYNGESQDWQWTNSPLISVVKNSPAARSLS